MHRGVKQHLRVASKLVVYQRRMPSLTLSKRPLPSESMGSKCFRSGSLPRLLLTQSEKASCSSIRTEWVVPSLDASDIPPRVSRFSRFETTCLKVVATSLAFNPAQSCFHSNQYRSPICISSKKLYANYRFEFVKRQPSFARPRLITIIFVNHLAHLPLRNLESAHVQSRFQFGQINESRTISVDLLTKQNIQISRAQQLCQGKGHVKRF